MDSPPNQKLVALATAQHYSNLADTCPMDSIGPLKSAIPPIVAQYRLFRLLGSGSTGIVYGAIDAASGRQVAIKLIPHLRNSRRNSRQVLREAKLARQVRHTNVVTLYDFGEYRGGGYLVLELVRGSSVASLIADGALPSDEATAIMIMACEGLMAVHAMNIIHRDIKPANLLRTADGTVKLIDFGIARSLDSSRRNDSWRQLTGTPNYMSPEQCRAEDNDERTDIYSLGATFYTLLTGQPPYAETDPLQVMFAHCSAPVPDPRNVHRDILPGCAEIVIRAMAKKRVDRYESVLEMSDALRAVLKGSLKS